MWTAVLLIAAIIAVSALVANPDEVRRQRRRMNRWAIPFCIVSLVFLGFVLTS